PRSSASCSTAGGSRRRQRRGWPSSTSSRGGTTRAVGTPRWRTPPRWSTSGGIVPPLNPQALNCPLYRGNSTLRPAPTLPRPTAAPPFAGERPSVIPHGQLMRRIALILFLLGLGEGALAQADTLS